MQYPEQFGILNLLNMSFNERVCALDDEFVLADNFNELSSPINVTTDPGAIPFISSPYPFKVQITMVMLCLGGTVRVQLNLNEFELHGNDVLIVQAGSIGQCLHISDDCRIAVVAISTNNEIFSDVNTRIGSVIRKFLAHRGLLHADDMQMQELLAIYKSIRDKMENPGLQYRRELVLSYMQMFFCNCCELMGSDSVVELSSVSRKEQIFERFMDLLKEHYAHSRNIGFYADKLCLTPKYLSQVIFMVSGRHAGEWIRDYVILEAKALLKSRQYTVLQVSDMLNFPNQSFFGVYFRKAVGCSPKAYQCGM
ncbi:MAG: helix-turn-helix transcriptional regulator [Coprobacter sp.]|nr:helix-turn-helix transcriptional regulator [Coprobacter sp.]